MPRTIVKTRGIVLRSRRMGETSRITMLYTEDFGKLKVTAKGARRVKSKFGSALELMAEVQAICYIRTARDLQTLSECELLTPPPVLSNDLQRFSFGNAAIELIDGLTIEGEANKRLYQCLRGVLRGLEEVDSTQVESLFWYYELRVLDALGYSPELRQCVACRRELIGAWLWFNPAQGGGMCAACGQGHGMRLPGESLQFLAHLQALKTYAKDVLPPTPTRRGEIRAAFSAFVDYYGSGRGHLRSLHFMESLSGEPSALNS
jgi:DNA repair protein RecO (recombination protein O)